MIYDKIENWNLYFKNPVFKNIFEVLKDYTVDSENGVFEYEQFYYKVMSYDTKESPTIIESHRKEVDIQIILEGREDIKMYHVDDLKVSKEYEDESDCVFYETAREPYTRLTLIPGYMAVFFPQDPHHPQFQTNNIVSTLKKIVIKVPVEHFK
jgi:YhcH/YjgK/YiaL family protein